MNSEIHDHLQQLDAAVDKAHVLTADLDDSAINWSETPKDGRWPSAWTT